MVALPEMGCGSLLKLSVLALSSRFDGPQRFPLATGNLGLSVLALSSRFDGLRLQFLLNDCADPFSTRSVESF